MPLKSVFGQNLAYHVEQDYSYLDTFDNKISLLFQMLYLLYKIIQIKSSICLYQKKQFDVICIEIFGFQSCMQLGIIQWIQKLEKL